MGIFDGFDPNIKMIDILGPPAYNNLDEPLPWANHIPTLEGLILSFLVSICLESAADDGQDGRILTF